MKTKFFRKNASVKAGASVRRWRWLRLAMTALLLWPMVLVAQNGVTVSGLVINAGTATFNVSWKNTGMPAIWSDTVWVFVDYNKNGVMTRLPLRAGATLTAHTAPDDVGKVIEVPGNTDGVWVVGNARSAGNFSATVKLLTAAAPAVSPGACAYASNYPPVGRYTTATSVSFTGTPMYKIVLKETGGTGVLTEYSDGLYTIRSGYAIQSFTDATGAPGVFHCTMPATQTLLASAAGYCEGATAVQFALNSTESGVVYQLYRDNAPVSGATLNGTGSAATFSGTFAAGDYRAEALPGATCPAAMSGTHTITLYPTPAPPTITGPNEACNSATLAAVPGDNGNGIRWDDDSTAPARTLTATTTCAAISTSPNGCTSAAATFVCTIGVPSGSGSSPHPLCGCACGLLCDGAACRPATSVVHDVWIPGYIDQTIIGTNLGSGYWTDAMVREYCLRLGDCADLTLPSTVRYAYGTCGTDYQGNHFYYSTCIDRWCLNVAAKCHYAYLSLKYRFMN